jgi:transcriptional regulator with XRE-family HTH domain
MTGHDGEVEVQPIEPFLESFGERMRAVREGRKMTQGDVARSADIYTSHVSDIERGRKQPTIGTLYRLARALRVHPADLLDDRDEDALLDRIDKEQQ